MIDVLLYVVVRENVRHENVYDRTLLEGNNKGVGCFPS